MSGRDALWGNPDVRNVLSGVLNAIGDYYFLTAGYVDFKSDSICIDFLKRMRVLQHFPVAGKVFFHPDGHFLVFFVVAQFNPVSFPVHSICDALPFGAFAFTYQVKRIADSDFDFLINGCMIDAVFTDEFQLLIRIALKYSEGSCWQRFA